MRKELQDQCNDVLEQLRKKNAELHPGSQVMNFDKPVEIGGQQIYNELLESMKKVNRQPWIWVS